MNRADPDSSSTSLSLVEPAGRCIFSFEYSFQACLWSVHLSVNHLGAADASLFFSSKILPPKRFIHSAKIRSATLSEECHNDDDAVLLRTLQAVVYFLSSLSSILRSNHDGSLYTLSSWFSTVDSATKIHFVASKCSVSSIESVSVDSLQCFDFENDYQMVSSCPWEIRAQLDRLGYWNWNCRCDS